MPKFICSLVGAARLKLSENNAVMINNIPALLIADTEDEAYLKAVELLQQRCPPPFWENHYVNITKLPEDDQKSGC